MKIPPSKSFDAYYFGNHVPRKHKKFILGRRLNKNSIRKQMSKLQFIDHGSQGVEILPNAFCPKCGCVSARSTGNMVEYPERYVKSFCLRCGFLVCVSDNGPYVHCLEFSKENFIIK